ncbi:XP_036355773.1uncharacterized protein LOC118761736 [Octopus vulgaris]|uniref:XP_036355773.1uncharacterized protein LOC118761736 n=1 Tax=Octopus vulgaris TaxID=6645 RepID=A0AA36EZA0_OCTVU|nr:XP_036355773.1uncharacterized protein LOC118761736 [Octopus vulgaris]
MNTRVSLKCSLITNISRRAIKDAEILICQSFPREIEELEDIACYNIGTIDSGLSHPIDFVSNEIITKYVQLKSILQNLEAHNSLIRTWVTFISRELRTFKDTGCLTSEESYSKLQQVADYCKQSLDNLSAYVSQIEELTEKCNSYEDKVFYQELEYLNKRHLCRINSMPEEIREKFLILTSVIYSILVILRPIQSARN